MDSWEITYKKKDKYTLYFDDDTHTYFLEGKNLDFQPVISVTQVLHAIFPKKYDGISPEVLKKAAENGTMRHNAISDYELEGKELDTSIEELKGYLMIKNYYCMDVVESERPILIKVGDLWIAGRYDELAYVKNLKANKKELSVVDFKFTSVMDKEYLLWQLNFYRLGIEYTTDYKIENLYGMHLKKQTRKMQGFPIITEENVISKIKEVM